MQILIYIIVLVLAFPVGYLLAWLARDELVAGRRWFLLLAMISVLAVIPAVIFSAIKLPIILSLMFLIIICLICIWKGYDKKWVKKI